MDGSYFYVDQSYDAQGRVDVVKYPGSVAGDTNGGAEADARTGCENRPDRRDFYFLANPSVAARSARALPGSNAEWPASGTMTNFDLGQALCRCQALRMGQTTS
jgi:hypothetical protein